MSINKSNKSYEVEIVNSLVKLFAKYLSKDHIRKNETRILSQLTNWAIARGSATPQKTAQKALQRLLK